MKMLITGDIHLSSTLRLHDFVSNLRVIEEKSQEINPEIYTIVGDIFDKRNPTSWAIKEFAIHLKNIKAKKVLIVKGNHDRTNDEVSAVDWTTLDKRVKVQDRFDFEVEGKKILLLHETIEGSKVGKQSLEMSGIKPSKFKHDLVVAGHIHKPQILSKKPLVLIPGSIEKVSFNERDEDKFFYLTEVTQANLKLQKFPLSTRSLLDIRYNLSQQTVEVNDCKVPYNSLQDLLLEHDKPVTHLLLVGKREHIRKLNYDKLIKMYSRVYSLDIKVEYENEVNVQSKSKNELDRVDVDTALSEYCKLNKLDNQTFKLAKKVIKETE